MAMSFEISSYDCSNVSRKVRHLRTRQNGEHGAIKKPSVGIQPTALFCVAWSRFLAEARCPSRATFDYEGDLVVVFLAAFFLATFFLVAAFFGAAFFLAAFFLATFFLVAAFFVAPAFFLATDISSEKRNLVAADSPSRSSWLAVWSQQPILKILR